MPEFAVDVRQSLFPALAEGIAIFTALKPTAANAGEDAASDYVYCRRICEEHGFKVEDARLWLNKCRYADIEILHFVRLRIRDPRRYAVPFGLENEVSADNDQLFAVNSQQFEQAVQILSEAKLVKADFTASSLWIENNAIRFGEEASSRASSSPDQFR
jgi:hypothetical protein